MKDCPRSAKLENRERPSWAGAYLNLALRSSCLDDVSNISQHIVIYMDPLTSLLQVENRTRIRNTAYNHIFLTPSHPTSHYVYLISSTGISEREPVHEPDEP